MTLKFIQSHLVGRLMLAVAVLAGGVACASAAKWSYGGSAGPEQWGSLDAKYAACAEGKVQSPIDIKAPFTAAKGDLTINYGASPITVANIGKTIQVNVGGNNSITTGGKTYKLLQFHFHAPSEEAVKGKRYPMDVHFVHATDAGELAVIGVLIDAGTASSAYAPIIENLPQQVGGSQAAGSIDPSTLLPARKSYWNYDGSLTTPPCSEGVNWFVMQSPVTLSKEQIEAYTKLYPNTARPLQPRNDREIRAVR